MKINNVVGGGLRPKHEFTSKNNVHQIFWFKELNPKGD